MARGGYKPGINLDIDWDTLNGMNLNQLNDYIQKAAKRANERLGAVYRSGTEYQKDVVSEMMGKFGETATTISPEKGYRQFLRTREKDINVAKHRAAALRNYLASYVGSNKNYAKLRREIAIKIAKKWEWEITPYEAEAIILAYEQATQKEKESRFGSRTYMNMAYILVLNGKEAEKNKRKKFTVDEIKKMINETAGSKKTLIDLELEYNAKHPKKPLYQNRSKK